MSRRRPDGVLLEWELAFPPGGDGLVPFLIDWHDSPHPAETLEHSVRLVSFRCVHPSPEVIAREVGALGQSLRIDRGDRPGLEAELTTRTGSVILR